YRTGYFGVRCIRSMGPLRSLPLLRVGGRREIVPLAKRRCSLLRPEGPLPAPGPSVRLATGAIQIERRIDGRRRAPTPDRGVAGTGPGLGCTDVDRRSGWPSTRARQAGRPHFVDDPP